MKKTTIISLISILSLFSALYYNVILDYMFPAAIEQTIVDNAVVKMSEEELRKLEQEETAKAQKAIDSINH